MNKILTRIIASIESGDVNFFNYILTFWFAVTFRHFIELFSDHGDFVLQLYIHYILGYTALACCLILIFSKLTKVKILIASKVILVSFLILILAPVLDLLFSKGSGFDMRYMLPNLHKDLLLRFFTFFGTLSPSAITIGMRIEIGIAIISSSIYAWMKTKNVYRSIILALTIYTLIFLFCALPCYIQPSLHLLKLYFWPQDFVLSGLYILIILIFGGFCLYLADSKLFKSFLNEIPFERVLHYELMLILGVALAKNEIMISTQYIVILILSMISLVFICLSAMVTNNIYDQQIDMISNPHRILVKKYISMKIYQYLQFIFMAVGLFIGLFIDFKIFFFMALFVGNYYIYSAPPLRLKRILYFSKWIIAINSLAMMMVGYVITCSSLDGFPFVFIVYSLFILPNAIQFIDIKDAVGDKNANILTLPILIGLKRSKQLIGLFFIITYTSTYFISKNFLLTIFAFITGIIQYYLINKKNYNEKIIFNTYLISVIIFIIYLFYNK